jgi:predicted DNA-binding mobile mystery protein A
MTELGRLRKRREMDEMLLAFKISRKRCHLADGWLRTIRQVTGTPVSEIARKLGVTRWEVFRMEQSEMNEAIKISTLRNAAKGLDCELVYALVPRETTLEEMTAKGKEAAEERRREREWERKLQRNPWMVKAGAYEMLIDGIRKALQRHYGVRVRPLKQEIEEEEVRKAFRKGVEAARFAKLATDAEALVEDRD